MIALPPVDPADFIMRSGDEMQKCINEYFTEITLEEATQAEILDPKYAPELLGELRAEYIGKLRRIWNSVPSPSLGGFDENYKAPPVEAAGDLDVLQKAYQAALKRTLRERLSKDYKDVVAYKRLLKEYGERLLWAMHSRFVNALADIKE
ncbi:MAG: hypothetical protein IKX62_06630 [Bacteroidales bacterium]|nr:hypothetical protein [Bacteroidales bacterium]